MVSTVYTYSSYCGSTGLDTTISAYASVTALLDGKPGKVAPRNLPPSTHPCTVNARYFSSGAPIYWGFWRSRVSMRDLNGVLNTSS